MYQVLAFSAIVFLSTLLGNAQQLDFQRRYVGNDVMLSYQWRNMHGETHSLVFRLPVESAARGNAEFQPFDNAAANTAAYRAVQKYAQRTPGLTVARSVQGFTVQYRGAAARQQQVHAGNIQKLQTEAFQADVQRQFYTEFNGYIMPDHGRVANRYTGALAPLVQALRPQVRGLSRRQTVEYVLNFLQSIPYDQLLNRGTSNGAGFQTPYGLFINNKGDCDTKAVALAAILRGLYPTQRLVMIYVPEHAFIGVHGAAGNGDARIFLDGQPFVLADPTGPALVPIGQPQPDAKRYMQARQYQVQEVPL